MIIGETEKHNRSNNVIIREPI